MKVVARLVYNNIPAITADINNGMSNVVGKTLADIKTITQESMSGSKSGRIYSRGSKYHQASAPGEAPAIDTGLLVNSISIDHQGLKGWVYTGVEYSEVLEYGGVRMAARPFFGPAASKAFPAFEEACKAMLRSAKG